MKKIFLNFISFYLLSHSLVSQDMELNVSKIPLVKYYDPIEYGGGIQNWAFALDTSGVLFVANNFDLLEYDGARWISHHVSNTTKLRSVYISKDNKVYVGGQGQIGYFNKSKSGYEFISLLDKLPQEKQSIEEVWKIVELDNVIYFNTSNRLIRLKNSNLDEFNLENQIQRIFKIDTSLIVQFLEKGLFKLSKDKFTLYPGTEDLTEIISIIPDTKGFTCFTTRGEIVKYKNGQTELIKTSIDNKLRSASINAAIRLSNGNIAIGTQNEGLFVLGKNFQTKYHFTRNKGLNDRTVLSIKEDNFKNLWVGLNNGINYLELNSPLSLINEEVGLEGTGYTSAIYDGRIYLGTNNGLFTKEISAENDISYKLIEGTEGQVYNLSIVEDELILNHHKGAFQISGTQLKQVHNVGSWKFIETSRYKTIIGGGYDGIMFFEKMRNRWVATRKIENLDISSRVLAFENDSTVWMTHGYKGAYLIKLNKDLSNTKEISFYGANKGFPSNVLISVYNLGESLVFAGETGIYNFDLEKDRFVLNTFLTEWLGNDHVSNITSNENGDIFFIANRELGLLNQESFGNYSKEMSIFKRINKLLSDDLEDISILDDRNVLIAAKEGFVHFDPLQDFQLSENFKTLIKEVEINFPGDSASQLLGSYFNDSEFPKNSSVKFQFAAPYFDGVDDVKYAYRLIGFDNKWSRWSADATKEYTNLPTGKFTFEVKAQNIYGIESDVAKTSFRILPKWYESSLAYTVYVSLIIISFGFISMIQRQKHRKEREKIVQSKEDAIKTKDEELTQVSRLSEEKIETLKNEKLKSEIKHKNTELASATMHLLNKNEFVQGIRKRIESLVSNDENSKDELKRILKTIDKNLNEDDSWDQFAFHFDQVHGDFLKKLSEDEIKLTGQETKLAAYLRMNMSSKEIANLMNISIRGVELARYRLRKKLNLDRSINLVEHLMEV